MHPSAPPRPVPSIHLGRTPTSVPALWRPSTESHNAHGFGGLRSHLFEIYGAQARFTGLRLDHGGGTVRSMEVASAAPSLTPATKAPLPPMLSLHVSIVTYVSVVCCKRFDLDVAASCSKCFICSCFLLQQVFSCYKLQMFYLDVAYVFTHMFQLRGGCWGRWPGGVGASSRGALGSCSSSATLSLVVERCPCAEIEDVLVFALAKVKVGGI